MTASTFSGPDDDDLSIRPAAPMTTPFKKSPIGDEGLPEWHEEGVDPGIWIFGLLITGAGVVALLVVLLMVLLAQPANSQPPPGTPGGPPAPTTYEAPPTAN